MEDRRWEPEEAGIKIMSLYFLHLVSIIDNKAGILDQSH